MTENVNWAKIQGRLIELGFDPGPVNGIVGPLTRRGVREFQEANNLAIRWPGTVGSKTLTALFGGGVKPTPIVQYPWIALALRKKGLHEKRDNYELSTFLKSDGKFLGDPAILPWCGDFIETVILRTLDEGVPYNPYLARNWQRFGIRIKPTYGAVGVFWRGSRDGIFGHVAFIVGEDATTYYVLGGNQKNKVSITRISKDRLLQARWPSSVDLPDRIYLPWGSGGKISINEA